MHGKAPPSLPPTTTPGRGGARSSTNLQKEGTLVLGLRAGRPEPLREVLGFGSGHQVPQGQGLLLQLFGGLPGEETLALALEEREDGRVRPQSQQQLDEGQEEDFRLDAFHATDLAGVSLGGVGLATRFQAARSKCNRFPPITTSAYPLQRSLPGGGPMETPSKTATERPRHHLSPCLLLAAEPCWA